MTKCICRYGTICTWIIVEHHGQCNNQLHYKITCPMLICHQSKYFIWLGYELGRLQSLIYSSSRRVAAYTQKNCIHMSENVTVEKCIIYLKYWLTVGKTSSFWNFLNHCQPTFDQYLSKISENPLAFVRVLSFYCTHTLYEMYSKSICVHIEFGLATPLSRIVSKTK